MGDYSQTSDRDSTGGTSGGWGEDEPTDDGRAPLLRPDLVRLDPGEAYQQATPARGALPRQ
eukprot:6332916-Prorocentrum_lima.AAC.1